MFALAGGGIMNGQLPAIGVGLAVRILLDTFGVRTLLRRWNWWPSRLGSSRHEDDCGRAVALPWACIVHAEVPVKSGPGHEMSAGCGGLRASHADREQAIEVLKAAFVEGRLAKDELDARVGQALTSLTHAELAAVTADLPAGPAAAQPVREPARTQAGPPATMTVRTGVRVITAATAATAASWAGALSGQADNAAVIMLVWTFTITWLGILILTVAVMLESRRQKRAAGGLPPPGTGGRTSLGY